LAAGLSIFLTGLMAGELGGGWRAQTFAALATVPYSLGAGAAMHYVTFDYLFWVLTAYFFIRLLRSNDARWWLAVGSAIGLGMMAKYTMLFLVAGMVFGVLVTDAGGYLKSKWLWCGVGVASLIFLPNFVWQVAHHFITIDFLQAIHARDVREGYTRGFFPLQFEQTLLAFPFWLAGLFSFLFRKSRRRFRPLAWMYLVPLMLFAVAQGRGYYLAPAYPMLYAEGSIWCEKWIASLQRPWNVRLRVAAWTAPLAGVLIGSVIGLPIAPVGTPWWKVASKIQGQFPEQIGWPELVETLAGIRDSLPPEQRAHIGILAGNYGEAGAVYLYGPRYGLPMAISGANSFWQAGFGDPPPAPLIVLGMSRDFVETNFASCKVASHPSNRYDIINEEIREHPDIYLCDGLRRSWADFWQHFQSYG
jgi:hypothetical protein